MLCACSNQRHTWGSVQGKRRRHVVESIPAQGRSLRPCRYGSAWSSENEYAGTTNGESVYWDGAQGQRLRMLAGNRLAERREVYDG